MSISVDNYNRKKESIAASAEKLFLALGYAGVSMDMAAADAAVTKQTVYRYFPSKKELFSYVMRKISCGGGFVFGRLGVLEELIRYGEWYIADHLSERGIALYRLVLSESCGEAADAVRGTLESSGRDGLEEYLGGRLGLSAPELYADMFRSMLTVKRSDILTGVCPAPDAYGMREHAEVTAEIFVNGVLGL